MVLGGTCAELTIPLNAIAMDAVSRERAGVASGIFNTARETGGDRGPCLGLEDDTLLGSGRGTDR